MPTMNDCLGGPDPDQHRSSFKHQDEECEPGYHEITLGRFDIGAELTSNDRVGFHRYTFGRKGRANIIFNLGCSLGPPIWRMPGYGRSINENWKVSW